VKPVNKDKSRLNEYVQKYNEELKKVATLKNIPLLDIFSAFMEKGHVALLDADDGLHPNAAGHEIIYQMVREQLGRMLDL
jgi:lysophospholipase L1-like esterase